MSFAKMQEALGKEGWFVGWNLPCCQTCAWSELAWFEHAPEDMSKVLFNHSQDCEVEGSEEECPVCESEGVVQNPDYEWTHDVEEWMDCMECRGTGYADFGDVDTEEYDTSISGFVCHHPEQIDGSSFCFDGSPEGVENLKAVLPIIEAAGCKVQWSGKGEQRPYISW